jgi:hypothetical protein
MGNTLPELPEYEVRDEVAGFLTKEEIQVVVMPRADFVKVVEDTLDDPLNEEEYAPIKDRMMKTARRIKRFALGTYIDSTRGCGCLVGEYLVAAHVINRKRVATREMSVTQALLVLPHGSLLSEFGELIDEVFVEFLKARTPISVNAAYLDAIVIED